MINGACLCGAVRFSGDAPTPRVTACHCSQCRRWSGHYGASIHLTNTLITGEVRWFRSSPQALRGFCPTCGSSLFWREDDDTDVVVSAGAVDEPTGLRLVKHINLTDKGDYYDVPQEVCQ